MTFSNRISIWKRNFWLMRNIITFPFFVRLLRLCNIITFETSFFFIINLPSATTWFRLNRYIWHLTRISWRSYFYFSLAAQFECPDKNGFYADPVQCDKYYECYDNKPTTKLCPDGLVFDENLKRYGKCDQVRILDSRENSIVIIIGKYSL